MTIHPRIVTQPLDERVEALESVQRAVLNILEDFTAEKQRMEEVHRATLNIFDDFHAEKSRQDDNQSALLNILQDSDDEKGRMQDVQRASLNLLDDFHSEKTRQDDNQSALLNILQDSDDEKGRMQDAQRASLNLLEDFHEEKTVQKDSQQALLNILDDIDAERAKITAVNEQLAAANKELEAFTYSVSHDLRAPLRHVDGFSKILLEEYGPQLPDDARRYLQIVRNGTRQMGELVDDLLKLARVGRQELRLQIAGLTGLVNEVLEGLKKEAAGREVEFRIGELPFVECDAGLLKQVLVNLLSNALKYTRPRARAVIEVGANGRDADLVIYVRDNGVGFNMKYAEKLFGIFQRLHRQEDFEGTGVGLATAQRIIHKHGGRVWAEAELDKGATFYFTLAGNEPLPNPSG